MERWLCDELCIPMLLLFSGAVIRRAANIRRRYETILQ